MGKLKQIFRDWMLIIAMVSGCLIYLTYRELDFLHPYSSQLLGCAKTVQPVLLFMMLFLSFCRIRPSDLKYRGWMGWLMLVQAAFFIVPTLAVVLLGGFSGAMADSRICFESFTLCMICPTATACSVLTAKLGGDRAAVMTYTTLINLLVAVVVPLIVPLLHPVGNLEFWSVFLMILAKVFPMLILPCLTAWFVRYAMPKLHQALLGFTDLAFNIWAVSLTLAILMSARAIYHSGAGLILLGGIALVSFISCVFQFWCGKMIGSHYDDNQDNSTSHLNRITAGQCMGQKSTVFAIWMGYTFLDPLTSVAGGFYSIWHNVFNSWQIYRQRKREN